MSEHSKDTDPNSQLYNPRTNYNVSSTRQQYNPVAPRYAIKRTWKVRYLISQRPTKLYLVPIVAAARTDCQNKIEKNV